MLFEVYSGHNVKRSDPHKCFKEFNPQT